MKKPLVGLAASLLLFGALNQPFAQGTAFTYNGRLTDNGLVANGNYDLSCTLYDAENGGNQVAGWPLLGPVPVVNGLFAVAIDFGEGKFTGPPRWLEVSVRRTGDTNFTTLSPRQGLTSSPYAIFAGKAAAVADNGIGALAIQDASVSAAKIGAGQVVKSLNGLQDDVTLTAGANVILTPNGNTLTISSAGNGGSGVWSVSSTNAYYHAGNVGIGTAAPQATLDIVSPQHALAMAANGPDVTFQDTAHSNARDVIQSVNGDLNLFTESYLSGANPFSFLKLANNGNVGIGSPTPIGKLEVVAQDALRLVGYNPFLTLFDSNAGYARSRIQGVGGDVDLFTESYLEGANPFAFLKLANNGNVGVGSALPVGKLEVVAQDALRLVGYEPFLTLLDSDTGYARSRIQGAGGEMDFFTENYLNGSDLNAYAKMFNSGAMSVKSLTVRDGGALSLEGNRTFIRGFDAGGFHWFTLGSDADIMLGLQRIGPGNYSFTVNGTTFTKTLTITGGSDVAEPFEMSGGQLPKGAVVVIDDQHPGQLKLSDRAYDQCVAGIVSGANGISPGLSLRQEGLVAGGQNVALSGRVYVLADATCGAIKPGDLLTTANTPGHAMKVTDHAKAQGAVLGKAMSALKEGKGLVLVLVSLQ